MALSTSDVNWGSGCVVAEGSVDAVGDVTTNPEQAIPMGSTARELVGRLRVERIPHPPPPGNPLGLPTPFPEPSPTDSYSGSYRVISIRAIRDSLSGKSVLGLMPWSMNPSHNVRNSLNQSLE